MAIEQNYEKKIYILLSLVVGIYILLRAVYFPVFTDEIATFFMYVQPGRIFPPDIAWDTNNHILNSLLVRWSYLLFGPSIFALRLPELLFFALYCYYVYKMGTFIRNSVVRWSFYVSMLATHYILEYMALSRGYGMSLALLTASLWYLLNTMRSYSVADAFRTIIFAILAVSANLNLIISLLIIFFILLLFYFLNFKTHTRKRHLLSIPVFIIGISGIWFFLWYSFTLLGKGRVFGGAETGLWDGTIMSLSKIVYNWFPALFAIFFTALFILFSVYYLFSIKKDWKDIVNNSYGIVFIVIIFGNLFSGFAMHHLLGTSYQEGRLAIYYIPLLYGSVAFSVDEIAGKKGKAILFSLAPLWFIPLFSGGQVSLQSSNHDKTPYVPYSFFSEIYSSVKPGDFPPTIVTEDHKRKLVWSYYNYLTGGKMNPMLHREKLDTFADYLLCDFDRWENTTTLYNEIDYNESSGFRLMKRKKSVGKHLILVDSLRNIPVISKKEYLKIIRLSIDSLNPTGLLVEFDFRFESEAVPFEGTIVCEIRDSTGARLNYEAINFDQLHPVWNEENNIIHHSLLLSPVRRNSKILLIYFWNKRKVICRILYGRTNIYLLNDQ